MQNEEFIALLKSAVKENRLDIIPDSDLIEICKRAREIDASSNNLDIDFSKTINTLSEEIKKRGLSRNSKPPEISNYKDSSFTKKEDEKRLRTQVLLAILAAIVIPLIIYALVGIISNLFDREGQNKSAVTKKQKAFQELTAEDWLNKKKELWDWRTCPDPKKAIEYLSNAIKLRPNYAGPYAMRGVIYDELLGQHQQAIKDYSEAIRLQPNSDPLNYMRGLAYARLGLYERAIEDFNKAIRIKPDNAYAYNCMGNAYRKLGQYQRAIGDYNKAIQLKPDYVDAYNNRGVAYFMHGNKELGCRDAQKTCALGNCKALEITKGEGWCR